MPNGTVGTAYSQALRATGDTPITWTLETGTLPAGLSLAANGTISGTPSVAGTSTFTVKATNAISSDTKQLSINIVSAITVNFEGFGNENIDISDNIASGYLRITYNGGITNIRAAFLDGRPLGEFLSVGEIDTYSDGFGFELSLLPFGVYNLTVIVIEGGVPYSKALTFSVN